MPNPYKGLLSPTFDANATNFIQGGGKIQVIYNNTTAHSRFDAQQNIIFMNDLDIKKTATVTNVSYDQAYAEILVHEMGHWLYAYKDAISYGNIICRRI